MPDSVEETSPQYIETIEREVYAECKQCQRQSAVTGMAIAALLVANMIWGLFTYSTFDRLVPKRSEIQMYRLDSSTVYCVNGNGEPSPCQ